MESCLKIGGEYRHGLSALLYKTGKISTLSRATTQNTTTTHNNQHEPPPPYPSAALALSLQSLGTPSITTMAVTSTGGLGKTRTANGNVCKSALSRLVFLYIAYRMVVGLSNFLRCKLLSVATSECKDAIRRKPAFLRRSSFVGFARRRP
jgi:hypothetical protein